MVSAIIIDGFLQKKKKDDKRNFLASKYQRRWFELTSDTLAYAKDAKELKDGGDIEVFAIHELKYVKKLEDDKLEMKFPERILRVKAESHEDHERWYEAIKNARQQKLDGANTPAAKQLENLKMTHTKAMLAESDDEDDNSVVGLGAHPVTPPKRGLPQDLVAKLTQMNTAAPQPAPVQSNRPPSPRSLLANPKLGLNIIGTPARSNGAEHRHQQRQQDEEEEDDEQGQHIRPVKPRSRWQEEEDEDEAERQRHHQQQQHQQPQQLLPQHPSSARNGTGSAVGTPRAGSAPASDRLTLNDNAPSPARLGSAGGASKASAADRLTLAEGARPGSGGAGQRGGSAGPNSRDDVGKAAPAQRGEKLALGGEPPGRRPVSSGEGEGARGAVTGGSAGPGAAQGSKEEIEDDDWDSSDDEELEEEEQQQQQQQPRGKGAAAGRVSGGAAQQRGSGVQGQQGAGTGAGAGSGANGVRTSHDRPAVQRPSPAAGGQGQGPSAGSKPGSAGRSQPPPPARHQDDGDEEEEAEEEKLAKKHAAGTDHLDDNWDSEEEDEEDQAPPPQQRRPPAAAPVAPQAPPPGAAAGGGRSRIPGLPPPAPASPQRLGTSPQKAGVAAPPLSGSGAGGRPRSRLSHGDDDEEEAPRRGSGRPAAAPAQQQQQEFKSNVVHDPNVREDKAWLEEDWDEDEDD